MTVGTDVVFRGSGAVTALVNDTRSSFKYVFSLVNNQLVFDLSSVKHSSGSVTLWSLDGKQIFRKSISSDIRSVSLPIFMNNRVFIVRVRFDDGTVLQKTIIPASLSQHK